MLVSKLRLKISMSLDGFVAGPDQSIGNPLGKGACACIDGLSHSPFGGQSMVNRAER